MPLRETTTRRRADSLVKPRLEGGADLTVHDQDMRALAGEDERTCPNWPGFDASECATKSRTRACGSTESEIVLQYRDGGPGSGKPMAQNITAFRRGRDMTTHWSKSTVVVFAVALQRTRSKSTVEKA